MYELWRLIDVAGLTLSEILLRRGKAHQTRAWVSYRYCGFEMASDTWIDNELLQSCHHPLGFKVVDRCVHYRKLL